VFGRTGRVDKIDERIAGIVHVRYPDSTQSDFFRQPAEFADALRSHIGFQNDVNSHRYYPPPDGLLLRQRLLHIDQDESSGHGMIAPMR
jgi:hypothetical protein